MTPLIYVLKAVMALTHMTWQEVVNLFKLGVHLHAISRPTYCPGTHRACVDPGTFDVMLQGARILGRLP